METGREMKCWGGGFLVFPSSKFKAATHPDRTGNRRFGNKGGHGGRSGGGDGVLCFSTDAFKCRLVHAYRPRQARALFHQLAAIIRKPLSHRRSFFSLTFPLLSSQHHTTCLALTSHLLSTWDASSSQQWSLTMSDLAALRYWLRETHLAAGHCYHGGNASGFAFSCEFPFTEIMGLNDLPREALILSIH